MPALNGDSALDSPPHPSSTNSAKRKRSQSTEKPLANGAISHSQDITSLSFLDRVRKSIRDVCVVLQSYDTEPSILSQPLPLAFVEPTPKRAKLSAPKATLSVLEKVKQDKYETLKDFSADITSAASQALSAVRPPPKAPDASSQWKFAPDSLEPDRFAAHLSVVEGVAKDLLRREARRLGEITDTGPVKDEPSDSKQHVNGDNDTSEAPETLDGRTVLTLFGNASGHKQLFSSFQKPLPKHLWTGDKAPDAGFQDLSRAVMPLRENGLPNQILSTQIVAIDGQSALPMSKRHVKFRDLFKPPATLPALSPPKPSKHSTTRGSTITWTREDDAPGGFGYSHAKLPTGHWLGYNGVAPTQEPATPEAKRKQRDRALSMGESTPAVTEEIKAVQAKAKEEALFRSAYSSFAPCKDNSAAVVPEEIRGQVWWQRFGEPRFVYSSFDEVDGQGDDEDVPMTNGVDHDDGQDEIAEYKAMLDQIDPALDEMDVFPTKPTDNQGNVDAALEEISELLETLQSHQRIRNSSIGPGARSSIGQASSIMEASDAASTPSEAELEVYNESKDRLIALISGLPPYVMSKRHGDQLAELILGRHIITEGKDYQGVLGEDQITRQQQAAALQAALGNTSGRGMGAPANRQGAYSQTRSNAQMQPYSPATRPPAAAARTPYSAWGNSAVNQARPSYTQPQQGYGRTPAPLTNRPGYSQPTGFPQSPSQPAYQQRAPNYTGSGINMHSPYGRNASPLQAAAPSPRFQQPGARPSLPGAPSASSYAGPSPLPPTSPYRAPPATMTGQPSSSGSRPQTPATPTTATAHRPGSADAAKSASGTPAPAQ